MGDTVFVHVGELRTVLRLDVRAVVSPSCSEYVSARNCVVGRVDLVASDEDLVKFHVRFAAHRTDKRAVEVEAVEHIIRYPVDDYGLRLVVSMNAVCPMLNRDCSLLTLGVAFRETNERLRDAAGDSHNSDVAEALELVFERRPVRVLDDDLAHGSALLGRPEPAALVFLRIRQLMRPAARVGHLPQPDRHIQQGRAHADADEGLADGGRLVTRQRDGVGDSGGVAERHVTDSDVALLAQAVAAELPRLRGGLEIHEVDADDLVGVLEVLFGVEGRGGGVLALDDLEPAWEQAEVGEELLGL